MLEGRAGLGDHSASVHHLSWRKGRARQVGQAGLGAKHACRKAEQRRQRNGQKVQCQERVAEAATGRENFARVIPAQRICPWTENPNRVEAPTLSAISAVLISAESRCICAVMLCVS